MLRGHQQLYRHRSRLGANLLSFILADFPRLVREQWRFVLAAGLMFFGSLIGFALLVYLFPDLVYNLIPADQVREMQSMYDPVAGHLGRTAERAASEDWVMFGYYIMHNIGIAFQTFASGLLLGLGSAFFLFFNGLMIGAVAGHLTRHRLRANLLVVRDRPWRFRTDGHCPGRRRRPATGLGVDRTGTPAPRRSLATGGAQERAADLRGHVVPADCGVYRSLLVVDDQRRRR